MGGIWPINKHADSASRVVLKKTNSYAFCGKYEYKIILMALLVSRATSELNHQSLPELARGINCPFGEKVESPSILISYLRSDHM